MTDISAAIAGIGATNFSHNSGRTELRLAVEAIGAALADAGIAVKDVGGFASFTMENTDEQALARALGIQEITFFARTPAGGGGACGTVALAAQAIRAGVVDVVICFRAMNEYSQYRFGQPRRPSIKAVYTSTELENSWSMPFGMVTPAARIAPSIRRYMHDYGVSTEDFGRVSVMQRQYAATNPAAYFYQRPITLEEHQNSRWVCEPLRLLDCCQESDGAVAVIVTSAERARDLRQPSVNIAGAAQGMGPDLVGGMASPFRANMAAATDIRVVGEQLWRQSGLRAADMDVAIIYDHFGPTVLMQLEALGFCPPGEAADFVGAGETAIDGSLPVNTNGGQLGEAYIHGFNGIAEAVRQIRGTAVNQVENVHCAVVTSGSHVPTSGLVLECG
jgi:acetyl-CoA acetyltransferase